MSDMSEHIKIALPQLAELDKQIDRAEDSLRDLRSLRQEIINAEARKVAQFKVDDEFQKPRGRRYRITSVTGDYYPADDMIPTSIVWVRYHGQRIFKKGTTGRTETVYPK